MEHLGLCFDAGTLGWGTRVASSFGLLVGFTETRSVDCVYLHGRLYGGGYRCGEWSWVIAST